MSDRLEQRMQSRAREQGPPDEPARPRAPLLALLALLAITLLLSWEVAASVLAHLSAPKPDDWRQAVTLVESKRQAKAEPLLFAPLWVDPVGRQAFGDQLSLEMTTLAHVDRFARVWQVSIRGARHPWLQDAKPAKTWTFGKVTVARFDRPAVEPLFDFYRQLGRATVDRVGASLTHCPKHQGRGPGGKPAARFDCDARQSWNWVGHKLAEIGHRPYRCIYAHPVDNHRIRIGFDDVRVGGGLLLLTGIDDFENRKKAQAPVLVEVFIDGTRVGAIAHRNDWAWHRTELDTGAYAGKGRSVRFEISSDVSFARTFCFTAETRR